MKLKRTALTLSSVVVLGTLVLWGWWWLHQPYEQAIPRAVAERFVAARSKGDFDAADELTKKSDAMGKYLDVFRVHGQACPDLHVVGISPYQSRGNRLRRWIAGQVEDMPEVSVEFEGGCAPFSVVLRRGVDGEWRVVSFGPHAG